MTVSGAGTNRNTIRRNYIGTEGMQSRLPRSVDYRDEPLPSRSISNGRAGVFISKGTRGSKVGGTDSTEGNIIAYNAGAGVEVHDTDSRGSAAQGNRITANSGGGISLYDGSNGGITAPTKTEVTKLGSGTTAGTSHVKVRGTAVRDGLVDVYSDPGNQGGTFMGRVSATGGAWEIEIDISDVENITATLTDNDGNTSPFAVFGRSDGTIGTTGVSTVDSDGDGVSNVLETLAGTNPDATIARRRSSRPFFSSPSPP